MAGCGVDDQVLLGNDIFGRVKHFKSPTDAGCGYQIKMWGVHLATSNIDAGLTVGYVDKTCLYKGEKSGPVALRATTQPAEITPESDLVVEISKPHSGLVEVPREAARAIRQNGPVAAISREGGVWIRASSGGVGAGGGLAQRYIIRLSAAGDRLVWIRSDQTGKNIYIKETEP